MSHISRFFVRGFAPFILAVVVFQLIAAVDFVRAGETSESGALIVAVRNVPPFAVHEKAGEWNGIAVALWRDIAAENGWKYEFCEMNLKDMLDALREGKVDVGVGATTVTAEREKEFDFTHPIHSSGLGMAVAGGRRATWLQVLGRLVSGKLLYFIGVMFCVMLITGLLVYLFEHRANRAHFGGGFFRGWGSGVWWALVTMTTVGYGDKAPRTVGGRIVAGVWMLSGLVVVAAFTAIAVAAFTISHEENGWKGPEDLARARVATVAHSTAAQYLDDRHLLFDSYPSVELALAGMKEGKHDVIVYDEPLLRYSVAQQFADQFQVLPATFERQDYAIALKNRSPIREACNQSLLKIIGRADWQGRLDRYLDKR